jgi:hypothetical protein
MKKFYLLIQILIIVIFQVEQDVINNPPTSTVFKSQRFFEKYIFENKLILEIMLRSLTLFVAKSNNQSILSQVFQDSQSNNINNKTDFDLNLDSYFKKRFINQLNESWFLFCGNRIEYCLNSCRDNFGLANYKKNWCEINKKKFFKRDLDISSYLIYVFYSFKIFLFVFIIIFFLN